MKYPLIIVFILALFTGCSRKHEMPKVFSGLPQEEQENDRIPVNLKNSDSVAWYTITGVMDTVKSYKCRLENWPEH